MHHTSFVLLQACKANLRGAVRNKDFVAPILLEKVGGVCTARAVNKELRAKQKANGAGAVAAIVHGRVGLAPEQGSHVTIMFRGPNDEGAMSILQYETMEGYDGLQKPKVPTLPLRIYIEQFDKGKGAQRYVFFGTQSEEEQDNCVARVLLMVDAWEKACTACGADAAWKALQALAARRSPRELRRAGKK